MGRLIVNADDFGFTKGVNLGIIEAFINGIVTSTTMMVNMPEVEHATRLAKQHASLGVGVHLVLTKGQPVHPNVPSLVNGSGHFHPRDTLLQHATALDVEREFEAQIDKFYELGLTPTHLDTHHHMHFYEPVASVIKNIAHRHQLPFRRFPANDFDFSTDIQTDMPDTPVVDTQFIREQATTETLLALIERSKNHSIEIMCHPGYVDQALLDLSSYNIERAHELAILTSDKICKATHHPSLKLTTF